MNSPLRRRAGGSGSDRDQPHLEVHSLESTKLPERNGNEMEAGEVFIVECSDAYERRPLREYYQRFGPKTVFIPVILGTKKPKHLAWPRTTFEGTQAPEYQAELREGNLGVLLGPASSDLIGVDCDSDSAAAQLELECPPAKETLQTRGARGRTFYFHPIGPYPQKIIKIKDGTGAAIGEWRGGGGAQTVVAGLHPSGCNYQILNGNSVQAIELSNFPWPIGWSCPWSRAPETEPSPPSDLFRRILAYLSGCPGAVSGNGGHSQTLKAATALVIGFGLGIDGARPFLWEYNKRCQPPWSAEELEHKLAEAAANKLGKEPGCLLADQSPSGGKTQQGAIHPGENGEFSPLLPVQWHPGSSASALNSPNSPNSPGGIAQNAPFPKDSILTPYYQYAVTQSEGADCYILGAIVPSIAALLARNVWVPWPAYDGKLYPNVYSILAGPPGNLKSTSIYPTQQIASMLLPKNRFLRHSYSPESLFDLFFKEPNRFLVCSDAGSTMVKWANPHDGQRISHAFLTLFDCEPMSESFRRNREKNELETQERETEPGSLSILFGSTLSKCQFNGNSERDGLQRRFLIHLATAPVRELNDPKPDEGTVSALATSFRPLWYLQGEFGWGENAHERFVDYKKNVKARMDDTDPFDESTRGRLSTLCAYVLKITMIFEAARICFDRSWVVEKPGFVPKHPSLFLRKNVLELAISYVEQCFESAQSLDDIANQKVIREQAESLLASIRAVFKAHPADPASIVVTRSELTRTYALHPKRASSWNVDDLYNRLIPYLIRNGEAKLLKKEGKKEIYAFRVES